MGSENLKFKLSILEIFIINKSVAIHLIDNKLSKMDFERILYVLEFDFASDFIKTNNPSQTLLSNSSSNK